MKTPIYNFAFLSLLFLIIACEGGTTFTKTIDNKSSESITIKLSMNTGYEESFTILSNETKQIYWDDQLGRFVDETYSCTQSIDSIEITISNNKTLNKDILNSENWQKESKDGRNSREDCTFLVTDADIE